MPESASHIRLVKALVSWLVEGPLSVDAGLLLVDSPDSPPRSRPSQIGGHVPDVCVPAWDTHGPILGEAKTLRDLEREHTLSQLRAFLNWCSRRDGALFVLAVPWPMVRLARAMLKRLLREVESGHVRTIVLDRLSG